MTGISLRELSSLSKKLNEASDLLTKQIAAFESALNELKLGVWAWVELSRHGVDSPWTVNGQPEPTVQVTSLGYGKHKGKWCLLFSTSYPDFGDDQLDEVLPLKDAQREERIEAVDKLPDLVRALEVRVAALAKRASDKAAEVATLVTNVKGPAK
jgi:hypothetical protein